MSYPAPKTRHGIEIDHLHVDPSEAGEAINPAVGDGVPADAPAFTYEDEDPQKTWVPTRKWMGRTVVAVSGWLVALIEAGWQFTDTVSIMLVTVITGAATSYIMQNDETPGGVPITYERARAAMSERGSISFVEGLLIVFLILGILFFLGGID